DRTHSPDAPPHRSPHRTGIPTELHPAGQRTRPSPHRHTPPRNRTRPPRTRRPDNRPSSPATPTTETPPAPPPTPPPPPPPAPNHTPSPAHPHDPDVLALTNMPPSRSPPPHRKPCPMSLAERLQSLFVALAALTGLALGLLLLPIGPTAGHAVLPALIAMLT